MRTDVLEKRNVTPEKAVEILAKNGVKVTHKEAEEILDIMYLLAKTIIKQHLRK